MESKVLYLRLLDSWSPDLAWFGKQQGKKTARYFLERSPDATVFTAFPAAPRGNLRARRLTAFIWLSVPGLWEAARWAEGPLPFPWRPPGRTPTRQVRRGGAPTTQPRGQTPVFCAAGGRELAEESPGGGESPCRRTPGRRELFPHGGAATCPEEEPERDLAFCGSRRTRVGRTHPDHEGLQRHREPGFRRLQSRQPAPFVSIALFRRGLCLVHQSAERGFAAAGASGAPEVPGATSFFSNSSWLPGAVRARVTVRV